jgi:hypothetical protein
MLCTFWPQTLAMTAMLCPAFLAAPLALLALFLPNGLPAATAAAISAATFACASAMAWCLFLRSLSATFFQALPSDRCFDR